MNFHLNESVLGGQFFLKNSWDDSNIQQLDCYTIFWNRGGEVRYSVDGQHFILPAHALVCLSPGQCVAFETQSAQPVVVQFNKEFYCIELHEREVSCNGLLFNGILMNPILTLSPADSLSFHSLLQVIVDEFQYQDNVQTEMLRLLLKRFIIKCTRIAKQQMTHQTAVEYMEVDIIRQFSALVDKHFRKYRQVADYAEMMHYSPKTLSNVFNKLGEKAPSERIQERVLLEAKRMLSVTEKPVKEIAYDLGYESAAHFSRFFKKHMGYSPSAFKVNRLQVAEKEK
ncbi:helix-turn-helix domain-containing protein [Rapidithrix thailandica]|uniref:Helix-turn-helix domain-containing protein n=1 Tax=Rapidithrix thailandica TaxID=413964 RepID=A0AAW9RSY2_9BACT